MKSDAPTVDAYLSGCPRTAGRRSPPCGRSSSSTSNGEPISVAALASQKRHTGKSCVRFSRLDDVPLDVVGEAISRISVDDLIAAHEQAHR